jgi:hypothetical protein
MLNKILCLIVILPICSCIGRNESSTLARENTESTVEFGASQIVEFTQESGEATSQLDISPDEKDGLADEKTQFIVVTNNNLEPPESRNPALAFLRLRIRFHQSATCVFVREEP